MTMNNILQTLISLSAQGIIAGCVVLLIRVLLGKQLKMPFRYALWAVVVIKLLIPVNITSTISIFNLFNQSGTVSAVVNNTTGISVALDESESEDAFLVRLKQNNMGITHSLPSLDETSNVTSRFKADYPVILIFIWIVIAIILLLWSFVKYMNLKIQIYKWRQEGIDSSIKKEAHKCIVEIGAAIKTDVVFSQFTDTPFVFGFLNPVIVLPHTLINDDNAVIRSVLYHEGMHVALNHHRMKFFAMLVQCVHWFNPFVYLFTSAFSADLELDCDTKVIQKRNSDGESLVDRVSYANTLLLVASKQQYRFAPVAAFAQGSLKNRVKNILTNKSVPNVVVAASFALVLILSITLLTGANPKKSAEYVYNEAYKEESVELDIQETYNEPIITKIESEIVEEYASQTLQNENVYVYNNIEEKVYEVLNSSIMNSESVKNIVIESVHGNVILNKTSDINSSAVFRFPKEKDGFYTLASSVDGETLTYRLKYNGDFKNNYSINADDYNLVIDIPDKDYDSLSITANAGKIPLDEFQFRDIQLKTNACAIDIKNSTCDTLKIDSNACSIDIKNNWFQNVILNDNAGSITFDSQNTVKQAITATFNASTLNIEVEELNYDIDINSNASRINVYFWKEPDNVELDLISNIGSMEVFSTWRWNERLKWSDKKLKQSITGTIGDGEYTLQVRSNVGSIVFE